MYLEFFQLKEHPFRLTPDPEFLFLGKDHSRAKAYMDYGIWNREGFVVITGEVGAGKTTLIQKLLSEFDSNVLVAKIFQTQLDDVEFLQAILVEFGLNPFHAKKAELMDMLSTFLVEMFLQSKQLVLIVDEAQNLSPRVLEEIRMLSGLETHKEKVLHVILAGQPELNTILDSPEMEQLAQRIRFRFHIRALTQVETKEYVAHRLHIAGMKKGTNIFSDERAWTTIYEYSGGLPRLINTLCDTALTCAFADNISYISEETVKSAVEELQWVPYNQRVRHPRTKNHVLNGHKPIEGEQLATLVPALSMITERMMALEKLLERVVTEMVQRERASPAKLVRPRSRR